MGLNRMMMKNGVDLKNIKAMMTIGNDRAKYDFQDGEFGSLSPNPLPNGVFVDGCYFRGKYFTLIPSSIKSCTINNITLGNYEVNSGVVSYLKQNDGKIIPVIFHFD